MQQAKYMDYTRDLTIILIKYQYTYLVSVYWYLYLVFRFPNTDTDTSYFKKVLEYWYFQCFSVFLKNTKELFTWYMIIPKIKGNFTPLLMAVITGHFQICNSILLDCFNWPFMIMATVIRSRSDRRAFLIALNQIYTSKWIAKVLGKYQVVQRY